MTNSNPTPLAPEVSALLREYIARCVHKATHEQGTLHDDAVCIHIRGAAMPHVSWGDVVDLMESVKDGVRSEGANRLRTASGIATLLAEEAARCSTKTRAHRALVALLRGISDIAAWAGRGETARAASRATAMVVEVNHVVARLARVPRSPLDTTESLTALMQEIHNDTE